MRRLEGCLDHKAHDEDKLRRREERVQQLLDAAVEQYAYGMELFDGWTKQRADCATDLDNYMKGKPESQKLEFLRLQIEMRVIGLGWAQFSTKWSNSADSRIGTVHHLRSLLVDEILPHERALHRLRQLPTEAAPPQHAFKCMGTLGTVDADAASFESKAMFSTEELHGKAKRLREIRVRSGVADAVERMQPLQRPDFNSSLVGK